MDALVRHVEAVLFAASDYISHERLIELTNASASDISTVLEKLKEKYAGEDSSMQIVERSNSWKFSLKNQYMSKVHDLIQTTELSKAVMETLAIIAWRAPIMQADLIKIRSTKAYDHVAELVEFGFITKERSGRSYVIKLTQKFYEYFDIGSQQEVQTIFEDISQRPSSTQVFPQKKVVDFDGTPRKSAQLKEPVATLQVYDVEEERRMKEETTNTIKDMRSNHLSYLQQLDEKLHVDKEERDNLVDSLRRHKADESEESSDSEDNSELNAEQNNTPNEESTPVKTEEERKQPQTVPEKIEHEFPLEPAPPAETKDESTDQEKEPLRSNSLEENL